MNWLAWGFSHGAAPSSLQSSPPPLQAEDLIKQGVALEEAGRLEEAVRLYEKVLRAEPENLELRSYIGGVTSQVTVQLATDCGPLHPLSA
jgi:hypothetical protein